MHKGIIIGIIAAVIIGGALSSPLFYESEVDEPLPVALDNIEDGLTLEKFSNMDDQDRQVLVEKIPDKIKDMIMAESATITRIASDDMESESSLALIKSGEFVGLAGHNAAGIAKIIDVNGDTFLRFEEFQVTNGPDLRVYITSDGDVKNGIHLEKLKGSKGDQNYSLNNIDVAAYDTVVIYCQPFGAYFGQAELN